MQISEVLAALAWVGIIIALWEFIKANRRAPGHCVGAIARQYYAALSWWKKHSRPQFRLSFELTWTR